MQCFEVDLSMETSSIVVRRAFIQTSRLYTSLSGPEVHAE
jgi:hypothetical protein